MGKTPGKWIKNFLLGKKSSKSSPSKGREALVSFFFIFFFRNNLC